jgi:hypothetical protein
MKFKFAGNLKWWKVGGLGLGVPASLFKDRTLINTYNTEVFMKGITFCFSESQK